MPHNYLRNLPLPASQIPTTSGSAKKLAFFADFDGTVTGRPVQLEDGSTVLLIDTTQIIYQKLFQALPNPADPTAPNRFFGRDNETEVSLQRFPGSMTECQINPHVLKELTGVYLPKGTIRLQHVEAVARRHVLASGFSDFCARTYPTQHIVGISSAGSTQAIKACLQANAFDIGQLSFIRAYELWDKSHKDHADKNTHVLEEALQKGYTPVFIGDGLSDLSAMEYSLQNGGYAFLIIDDLPLDGSIGSAAEQKAKISSLEKLKELMDENPEYRGRLLVANSDLWLKAKEYDFLNPLDSLISASQDPFSIVRSTRSSNGLVKGRPPLILPKESTLGFTT
jgi:hypothetical protein